VQCLDVAVGLRSAGVEARVRGAEFAGGGVKSPLNSLALSLSKRSSRQPAVVSSAATRRAKRLVLRALTVWPFSMTSSAHA